MDKENRRKLGRTIEKEGERLFLLVEWLFDNRKLIQEKFEDPDGYGDGFYLDQVMPASLHSKLTDLEEDYLRDHYHEFASPRSPLRILEWMQWG